MKNKQKRFWIGLTGLALGFYMIFFLENNSGVIPALISVGVLIWNGKRK